MKNCSNLYFLSTIACKLADCLAEDEMTFLSADLMTLSDMLNSIAAREAACKSQEAAQKKSSV